MLSRNSVASLVLDAAACCTCDRLKAVSAGVVATEAELDFELFDGACLAARLVIVDGDEGPHMPIFAYFLKRMVGNVKGSPPVDVPQS